MKFDGEWQWNLLIQAMLDRINTPNFLESTEISEILSTLVEFSSEQKIAKEGLNSLARNQHFFQHLQNSLRNIADNHLHQPIRKKESLPNRSQINFSNDLDVVLAEVIRLLK